MALSLACQGCLGRSTGVHGQEGLLILPIVARQEPQHRWHETSLAEHCHSHRRGVAHLWRPNVRQAASSDWDLWRPSGEAESSDGQGRGANPSEASYGVLARAPAEQWLGV